MIRIFYGVIGFLWRSRISIFIAWINLVVGFYYGVVGSGVRSYIRGLDSFVFWWIFCSNL